MKDGATHSVVDPLHGALPDSPSALKGRYRARTEVDRTAAAPIRRSIRAVSTGRAGTARMRRPASAEVR